MTGLSVTACCRCREQKLRCSREQPECARCTRAGVLCSYPRPPDRKSLAALRGSSRKRSADERDHGPRRSNTVVGAVSQRHALPSPLSSTSPAELSNDAHPSTPVSVTTALGNAIPRTVIKLFVDVYFSCAFNSSLIFHRPTFERALEEDSLPQHTLLAVCALATNFLGPSSTLGRQHASQIRYLGDLTPLGRQWALSAGSQVLPNIDQPTLQSIQTCQVLSLYWFANGDLRRNGMFSGIAIRAVRMRMLDQQSNESQEGWLESENERRCFWASWIQSCINSDNYVQGTSADKLAQTLPLPISEFSFVQAIQETHSTLRKSFDSSHPRLSDDSPNSHPSIMAQALRIVVTWAQTCDHVESRNNRSAKDNLAELFALDGNLSEWASDLPESLSYSKRNLYEQLVVKKQFVYTVMHVVHRQCRLVLYSSIVPQFSGLALKDVKPPEVVTASAQIALKSAKALSDIAADILALEWNPAQIAAFVGYSMYAAASIHMTFVFSRDSHVADEACKDLTSCLELLKAMKPYWKVLDKLWSRICLLYEVQAAKFRDETSSADEMGGDPRKLEQVANLKRDTGRLNEPLKDSLLQYSLGKLRQVVDVEDSALSNNSVRTMHLEQVVGLLSDKNKSQAEPASMAQETDVQTLETPSMPSADQIGQNLASVSETMDMGPNMAPWGLYDIDDNDSWQINLGALPQGWLTAEDYFTYY